MTSAPNDLTPEEAQNALNAVETMELAGWRRSVPPRWVCAGYAFFSGGTISMFAIEPLRMAYFLWWLVAYIIFMSFAVKSVSANEREYHPPKERRLSYWGCWFGLLIAGAGGIYFRYEFDANWIAVAGGIANGIWMYLYYEIERRSGFNKSQESAQP